MEVSTQHGICALCGTTFQNNDNGYCKNGHDAWIEAFDFIDKDQFANLEEDFLQPAADRFGITLEFLRYCTFHKYGEYWGKGLRPIEEQLILTYGLQIGQEYVRLKEQYREVDMTDITFEDAETDLRKVIKEARLLSTKNWNTYFQILHKNRRFSISKYHDSSAIGYCLKGRYYNHVGFNINCI